MPEGVTNLVPPSRVTLTRIERETAALGYEHRGPLSESHGFMPQHLPLQSLPPEYAAWDELAAQMPELYGTMRLREAFEQMPLLSALADALPERYVWRANLIVSLFAHTYWWSQFETPTAMPESIALPWRQLADRLEREHPFLAYHDIFLYNWQFRDPELPDPMRVENLDLLVPAVGNKEERYFFLPQMEIIGQAGSMVGAVVRAQEAVLREDCDALKTELMSITDVLQHVTQVSFQKIDVNPMSKTYVDPVVWAKTIARLGLPIRDDVPGASGTAGPPFQVLDAFLGRSKHDTHLGKDVLKHRRWYPRNYREFLDALEQVSVRDFVARVDDPCLAGIYHGLVEAWIGEKGFLGAHRLKVYGFLDTAYKVGRPATTGGFHGEFGSRPWDLVDRELAASREERYLELSGTCPFASVARRAPAVADPASTTRKVVLDIDQTGMRYSPGDRLGVLTENPPELVNKTLKALHGSGDEVIRLSRKWRIAVRQRPGMETVNEISLREFLRFAKLRPLLRKTGKDLVRLSGSRKLHEVVETRTEDQWELWDALELALSDTTYDARRLWRADPWLDESISNVVPPERFRLYSISSALEDPKDPNPSALTLTVGGLTYSDQRSGGDIVRRRGTASTFLTEGEIVDGADPRFAVKPMRPSRFFLPPDTQRPVVMFAGGTGIAPFRGFIQARAAHSDAGANWLFLGTRTPAHFLYEDELEGYVRDQKLHVRVAFSHADKRLLDVDAERFEGFVVGPGERGFIDLSMSEPQNAAQLWEMMRSREDGGTEGYFYVCGQTRFADCVMKALADIAASRAPVDVADGQVWARDYVFRLFAEKRFMLDIFTTFAPQSAPGMLGDGTWTASQVAVRNNDDDGYWLIINGKVYDLTEFAYLHPGGAQIIKGYAGMDATGAYEAVLHHENSEVGAMLDMYEIGKVRRLDFKSEWGIALTREGIDYVSLLDAYRTWIRYIYLVVEMENTLWLDFDFLRSSVTRHVDSKALTPLKVELVSDAHDRFMNLFFDSLLSDELREVWAVTVGLCDAKQPLGRVEQALDQVSLNPEAFPARRAADVLHRHVDDALLSADAQDAETRCARARLLALCDHVEHLDKDFLRQLKLQLVTGLEVFERHEQRSIEDGGAALVRCLQEVVGIVEAFHQSFSAGLVELGVFDSDGNPLI